MDNTRPAACQPPRVTGTDPDVAWQSAATAAAATSSNLWSGYVGSIPPKGKVWVELEAVTYDVYVRFSRTATTGTTSSNGSIVKAGYPAVVYFVDPSKDLYLDHLSPGGVGVVKWRVVSSLVERIDI